jgi:hypothetical protein
MVSGSEAQVILGNAGKIRPEIKKYLIDYTNRVTEK